jgi:putative transposase
MRQPYPTDLVDAQWAMLAPLVPAAKPGGRPRSADVREVINAVLYHLRNGGTWRSRPHDLPPWKTVYPSCRAWRLDGTWERVHEVLRERVRAATGRDPPPSAAILDRQSVTTTEKGGLAATTRVRR